MNVGAKRQVRIQVGVIDKGRCPRQYLANIWDVEVSD